MLRDHVHGGEKQGLKVEFIWSSLRGSHRQLNQSHVFWARCPKSGKDARCADCFVPSVVLIIESHPQFEIVSRVVGACSSLGAGVGFR